MKSPLLNQPAPDFTREAHDGQKVRLSDYLGHNAVVLYFYPRDFTSLCTKQACGFRGGPDSSAIRVPKAHEGAEFPLAASPPR
jgi:peroxiredoxin